MASVILPAVPSESRPGRFGVYGGRYVPETLMAALLELEHEYEIAKADAAFQAELAGLLKDFAGRPTPLYFAKRLTEELGGAKIYLKREDLLHTGAHKINNALGQGLLAKRMGKKRIIAETGAGQHGVATATVCALLDMECVIYMGDVDMERQELNVMRMRLLGAEVRGVSSGSKTLKDAINEAMRDWVTNVRTTYYLLGSALGAHPYPTMVRDFHRVISIEMKEQILEKEGRLPTAVIACVGGGSNAIGAFYEFIPDKEVRLIGVEAGGRGAALANMRRVSTVERQECCKARIRMCCRTRMGRSRPRIRFRRVWITRRSGRSTRRCMTRAARSTSRKMIPPRSRQLFGWRAQKGFCPHLRVHMRLPKCLRLAPTLKPHDILVVNLSGRGDKDMGILARELKLQGV